MDIKPVRDRILVKAEDPDKVTSGGIVIPENAFEAPTRAEVVAVGSGKVNENGITIPMEVKVGDTIMLQKFTGIPVKIDNVNYIFLKEDEILAIIY